MKNNAELFKMKCTSYLHTQSINALRAYGRQLQLRSPTKMRKGELIEEIVKVLCGESAQQRGKKGAPIKNDYVQPKLLEEITCLQREYLGVEKEEAEEEGEEAEEETGVSLQFAIKPAMLSEEQKRYLTDFLNSL